MRRETGGLGTDKEPHQLCECAFLASKTHIFHSTGTSVASYILDLAGMTCMFRAYVSAGADADTSVVGAGSGGRTLCPVGERKMLTKSSALTLSVCAFTALLLSPVESHGAAILDGLYNLSNHPDAAQGPPGYGIRLDELIDVTGSKDVFTFDFDDSRSNMLMEVSGSTIRIFGIVFGGLDVGDEYDDDLSGLWDVDFTYNNAQKMPNDNDVWVRAGQPTNTGSISALFDNLGTFGLTDYAGNHPFTFRLGDENSDDGHRGFDGISGWGWLNHGDRGHIASSDFIFTATPVPVPPAVLLGAMGLLGMVGVKTRRKMKNTAS